MVWTALGVLVVNDHVLKGAGVLPGWLTGKLSDFAGLVVAPLVACALLEARGRVVRLLGFAAVVVPFVAIKTVPLATHWVEALACALGLRWRLWTDPWDLVGLVVLPLSWRLATGPHAAPHGKRAPMLERIGAIGAAAACLATSDFGSSHLKTSVAIVNLSLDDVVLQVFRPSAPLDCSAVAPDPETALGSTDFATNKCLTLTPHQTTPLDLWWSREDDYEEETSPYTGPSRPCEAVLLRASGLDDVVLFWNEVEQESILEYTVDAEESHLASIDRVGARLFISGPSVATVFAPGFVVPETSCGRLP